MIRFDIYETETGKLDRTFRCRDGMFGYDLYETVYDYLMRRFNLTHEEAEEAASWCEFSVVGEWYEAVSFVICVEEE